jgi:hypothetical protein
MHPQTDAGRPRVRLQPHGQVGGHHAAHPEAVRFEVCVVIVKVHGRRAVPRGREHGRPVKAISLANHRDGRDLEPSDTTLEIVAGTDTDEAGVDVERKGSRPRGAGGGLHGPRHCGRAGPSHLQRDIAGKRFTGGRVDADAVGSGWQRQSRIEEDAYGLRRSPKAGGRVEPDCADRLGGRRDPPWAELERQRLGRGVVAAQRGRLDARLDRKRRHRPSADDCRHKHRRHGAGTYSDGGHQEPDDSRRLRGDEAAQPPDGGRDRDPDRGDRKRNGDLRPKRDE